MNHEGDQPGTGPSRAGIIEAAAWVLVVLIILAIFVLANLPCGGARQISCQLLETLLYWTLRAFVLCLVLVTGFSLRRRTGSIGPDESDSGDWNWLP